MKQFVPARLTSDREFGLVKYSFCCTLSKRMVEVLEVWVTRRREPEQVQPPPVLPHSLMAPRNIELATVPLSVGTVS